MNESEASFQAPPCCTYTSVTSKGFVTSLPPTTASRRIVFNTMAVVPMTRTDAAWISACLYQMLPLRMTSSSRGCPHVPPMWTKTACS